MIGQLSNHDEGHGRFADLRLIERRLSQARLALRGSHGEETPVLQVESRRRSRRQIDQLADRLVGEASRRVIEIGGVPVADGVDDLGNRGSLLKGLRGKFGDAWA